MDLSIIRSDKTILGGKKRIAGTRISVGLIYDCIDSGFSVDDIKRSYPHLTDNQIKSALLYIEKSVSNARSQID